jgi:hypothetical protein
MEIEKILSGELLTPVRILFLLLATLCLLGAIVAKDWIYKRTAQLDPKL